jgi:hypothetical protein
MAAWLRYRSQDRKPIPEASWLHCVVESHACRIGEPWKFFGNLVSKSPEQCRKLAVEFPMLARELEALAVAKSA